MVSLRPGRFTPGERAPDTHSIGGWVDHRASLDDMENRKFLTIPGLELRPLGRPASSQSLQSVGVSVCSTLRSVAICNHTMRSSIQSHIWHQLPRVLVAIDGVWISKWIYWTLLLQVTIELSLIHTLCSSLELVLSLRGRLCLQQSLPGDESNNVICIRVHVLTCWRLYHNWFIPISLLITLRHGPHRKHLFSVAISYCCVASHRSGPRRKQSLCYCLRAVA
jgi:hypothetical protein